MFRVFGHGVTRAEHDVTLHACVCTSAYMLGSTIPVSNKAMTIGSAGQAGVVHGIACWFDVLFDGSTTQRWLSTAPGQPTTHW